MDILSCSLKEKRHNSTLKFIESLGKSWGNLDVWGQCVLMLASVPQLRVEGEDVTCYFCTLMWNVCFSSAPLVLGERGYLSSAPEQNFVSRGPMRVWKDISVPLFSSALAVLAIYLFLFTELYGFACPHYLCCSFQVHFPPALLSVFTVSSNDCSC